MNAKLEVLVSSEENVVLHDRVRDCVLVSSLGEGITNLFEGVDKGVKGSVALGSVHSR